MTFDVYRLGLYGKGWAKKSRTKTVGVASDIRDYRLPCGWELHSVSFFPWNHVTIYIQRRRKGGR